MPTTVTADEVRFAYRLASISDRVVLFEALAVAAKRDATLARDIFPFIREHALEADQDKVPEARLKVLASIYEGCSKLATAKDVGLYLDFYTNTEKRSAPELRAGVPNFLPVLKAIFLYSDNTYLEDPAIKFVKANLSSADPGARLLGVAQLVELGKCTRSLKQTSFGLLMDLNERENGKFALAFRHYWDDPEFGNTPLLEKFHEWGAKYAIEKFTKAHPERMPWTLTARKLLVLGQDPRMGPD
jgi:hypothetical protein